MADNSAARSVSLAAFSLFFVAEVWSSSRDPLLPSSAISMQTGAWRDGSSHFVDDTEFLAALVDIKLNLGRLP